jgi:beta-lactamase class A
VAKKTPSYVAKKAPSYVAQKISNYTAKKRTPRVSKILSYLTHTHEPVTKRLADIERKYNTVLGITAVHIEKNKVVTHNGKVPFFMASTVKLPIALTFLHRVDENKDSLNHVIKLDSHNSVPGSGSLHYAFEKKPIHMSLKQVLNLMMINSDNSASDTILRHAAGPQAVTQHMTQLGFKNTTVDRSILETLLDTNAVDHTLLNQPRSVLAWQKQFNQVPLQKKAQAWQIFQNDKRDTTTPDDMATLLVKLYNKQVLSEANTELIMQIMERCRTGRSRIRGLLPPSVRVAHKTGTWAIYEPDYLRYPASKKLFRFASDVGIITLPKNKGHVAIAIYVKSKSANDYNRSRAIALASRAIYDHFMTQ